MIDVLMSTSAEFDNWTKKEIATSPYFGEDTYYKQPNLSYWNLDFLHPYFHFFKMRGLRLQSAGFFALGRILCKVVAWRLLIALYET